MEPDYAHLALPSAEPVPNDHAKADLEAEERVIAYYLVLAVEHPCSSKVKAHHFAWPSFREYWTRALAVRTIAQPSDIGIPLDQAMRLSDLVVLTSSVRALEGRVIASAAARVLAEVLGEAALRLATEGAEGLSHSLAFARAGLEQCEAGLPSASCTQATVGGQVVQDWLAMLSDPDKRSSILPMPSQLSEIGGWWRKKLHVVVGRPSEHKTTLLRASAEVVARAGFISLGWTFEDSKEDLAARTIASQVPGLSTRALILGQAAGAGMETASAAVDATEEEWCSRLRWIDKGAPRLSDVVGRLRTERAKGLDFVTLDYGQLIQPDRGWADTQHWRLVTSTLAALAKELDIALVVALQIDKVSTKETIEKDRRPPLTIDALGGACWYQDCFMSICIGAKPGRTATEVVWETDKSKAGAKPSGSFWVNPARDLIGVA